MHVWLSITQSPQLSLARRLSLTGSHYQRILVVVLYLSLHLKSQCYCLWNLISVHEQHGIAALCLSLFFFSIMALLHECASFYFPYFRSLCCTFHLPQFPFVTLLLLSFILWLSNFFLYGCICFVSPFMLHLYNPFLSFFPFIVPYHPFYDPFSH